MSNRAETFLKSLVDAPSSTFRQDDVRETHKLLAVELENLGFTIDWLIDPSGKSDRLLVAEKPGTSGRFITCVSHIDTVLSPQEAGPYRTENVNGQMRARGAGIIDNKGGLAVLVESLRLYFETNPMPQIGFRIVSSPDEENGSTAWHEAFRKIGEKSHAALGFEPALDDGSIISSRRGNRWYNFEFEGVEAHAGRCKGEEINAAHEASLFVVGLIEIRERLRKEFRSPAGLGISLQVGHIEGGRDRHNVVCGKVSLKLDTRFSTFEERDALHGEILKLMKAPRAQNTEGRSIIVRYEIVDDCPPFAPDPSNENLVTNLARLISTEECVEFRDAAKAGGAGDVNHMSRPGLLVLDGLGPVGGKMHTADEFLALSSLNSRAKSLANWYPELVRYVLL